MKKWALIELFRRGEYVHGRYEPPYWRLCVGSELLVDIPNIEGRLQYTQMRVLLVSELYPFCERRINTVGVLNVIFRQLTDALRISEAGKSPHDDIDDLKSKITAKFAEIFSLSYTFQL